MSSAATSHQSNQRELLLSAARRLQDQLKPLQFSLPVAHVYNPLDYAWQPFQTYVEKFGAGAGRAVLLGMNPGPYGMMQVGVPFGEVAAVRDWMGIQATIDSPTKQHPKRPIEGFACKRSEVSGRRLWGWAAEEFGSAEIFFKRFFVINYCPLIWLEESGRNRTPEQIPSTQMEPVTQACDQHLAEVFQILKPRYAIGIGGFATKRIETVLKQRFKSEDPIRTGIKIGTMLHPSPASPAANRGWAQQARQQLVELGVI
jgi:single-strand selective monofunctional uracil DNA glycosylase